MNLDYERNVCFTEATNSGLFTKKKLKRKNITSSGFWNDLWPPKTYHVTSFQNWCHVVRMYFKIQAQFKIFFKIHH